MKPLQELECLKSGIKGVCFDIDDTFTSNGKITSKAFESLWKLKTAGFFLIPVTGRPAGWCDHIARFWPVDGVVGENGAFSFFMHKGKRKRIDTLPIELAHEAKSKLVRLRKEIEISFPGCSFASDQEYREYDLAIDFCEDVTPWTETEVDRLVRFCESKGAIAKVSSIHVNTWFGTYTKIDGIRHFLAAAPRELQLPAFEELVFIGDSPNDEPMFEAFPISIGVANVRPFLSKIKNPPKFITLLEAGSGFAELSEFLRS
ncbi:MAG: HAD-IIB family hydrolase [Bdellovibrionales bacterium]|nr:HAD-IIB family hydrolase [Bdellovibrionales bacterium]